MKSSDDQRAGEGVTALNLLYYFRGCPASFSVREIRNSNAAW